MKKITKGWKVFDADLKCRNIQFKVGETYKQTGTPVLCEHGFHFHTQPSHLFNYYSFDPKNRVCEITAFGKCDTGDDKSCCNEIKIGKELSWNEVLTLVNSGVGNTGRNNTGHQNTGDRNTGHQNTGHQNTGDRNTGHQNTGHRNTGDQNTGHQNTGHRNTGHQNTGDRNTGDQNTGHRNTGDQNTGHRNTGDRNTGDRNTGHQNTGHRNTGDQNTGHQNTGHQNTGHWNTTNHSAGIFNTTEQPTPIFNGAATVLMSEFKNTNNYNALFSSDFPLTEWIYESKMTDEEKAAHPKFYVQEGYLKKRTFKEASKIWWENMSERNKKLIRSIPGFTPSIFTEVTGIEL